MSKSTARRERRPLKLVRKPERDCAAASETEEDYYASDKRCHLDETVPSGDQTEASGALGDGSFPTIYSQLVYHTLVFIHARVVQRHPHLKKAYSCASSCDDRARAARALFNDTVGTSHPVEGADEEWARNEAFLKIVHLGACVRSFVCRACKCVFVPADFVSSESISKELDILGSRDDRDACDYDELIRFLRIDGLAHLRELHPMYVEYVDRLSESDTGELFENVLRWAGESDFSTIGGVMNFVQHVERFVLERLERNE